MHEMKGRGRGHRGHHDPLDDMGEGRGRGQRRRRLFKAGDLKLLLLEIIHQQPSHGYEVIRSIEALVGGDYSPSPGTIYPTLSLLEDMGLVASAADGGRKSYRITAAGETHLQQQQPALAEAHTRLQQVQQVQAHGRGRRIPAIRRAMENLKTALRLQLEEGEPEPQRLERMAAIIDAAALEIEKV